MRVLYKSLLILSKLEERYGWLAKTIQCMALCEACHTCLPSSLSIPGVIEPMTKANSDSSKKAIFHAVAEVLAQHGLNATTVDSERPWGGFYVIDEAQTAQFIDVYFGAERGEIALGEQKLSPKILIVEPEKRLSWQYHHRRTELWKVVNGKAGVMLSETDQETTVETQNIGDVIRIGSQLRHRIVGLDSWGVLAEIWQHSDPANPSNEDDIVRVNDDFGR